MGETRFSKARENRAKDRAKPAVAKINEDHAKAVEADAEADKKQERAAAAAVRRARAFSCHLDPDVQRELRVAVSQLPPASVGGGLSPLVERALRSELTRLRKEFNEGQPFEGEAALSPGRPPKTP